MENGEKNITVEELKALLQSQQGEFIIHMEFRKGATDGEE